MSRPFWEVLRALESDEGERGDAPAPVVPEVPSTPAPSAPVASSFIGSDAGAPGGQNPEGDGDSRDSLPVYLEPSDIGELVGVSGAAIKSLERRGLIHPSAKTVRGVSLFTTEDVAEFVEKRERKAGGR